MSILNETVPTPPNPERPPLGPYDPPEPAPQADAWRRALKVVSRGAGIAKTRAGRSRARAHRF
jgi:hypothetical protein